MGVKWRRFIVPKKVEQINDHLFIVIDTYKSNNIQIGVNDMTVNDSEMYVRWKDETWSITYTVDTVQTQTHASHVGLRWDGIIQSLNINIKAWYTKTYSLMIYLMSQS